MNNSFARIPFTVMCRFHELTRNEIIVFCTLIAHRNAQTGLCNPLQKTIAAETGLNKTRISEAISGLIFKKWIKIENGNFCLLALISEVTENVTESYGKRNLEVTENVTESYGKRNSLYKEEQTIKQTTENRQKTERETPARTQENSHRKKEFYEKCLNGLKHRFKTPVRLKNEAEWLKPIAFWWENGGSAENLLEVFDVKNEIRIRKHETWQMTPRVLESCFGTLEALKIELENVKNRVKNTSGVKNTNANTNTTGDVSRKRTPAEVILSRDFSRYDAPSVRKDGGNSE